MEPLRQIANLLDPLALLRAVVAAWPLGVAIMLDWPVIHWWLRSRPRRAGKRLLRGRAVPGGWLAVLINLAAAGSTLLAIWCADQLLAWLPGQFGDGPLIRAIAERRVRAWEAALLLPMVTMCVLGVKAVTLRALVGRWPGVWAWTGLAAAWAGLLGLVWSIGRFW